MNEFLRRGRKDIGRGCETFQGKDEIVQKKKTPI